MVAARAQKVLSEGQVPLASSSMHTSRPASGTALAGMFRPGILKVPLDHCWSTLVPSRVTCLTEPRQASLVHHSILAMGWVQQGELGSTQGLVRSVRQMTRLAPLRVRTGTGSNTKGTVPSVRLHLQKGKGWALGGGGRRTAGVRGCTGGSGLGGSGEGGGGLGGRGEGGEGLGGRGLGGAGLGGRGLGGGGEEGGGLGGGGEGGGGLGGLGLGGAGLGGFGPGGAGLGGLGEGGGGDGGGGLGGGGEGGAGLGGLGLGGAGLGGFGLGGTGLGGLGEGGRGEGGRGLGGSGLGGGEEGAQAFCDRPVRQGPSKGSNWMTRS